MDDPSPPTTQCRLVAGVDEVGRGCLAGPVMAGAIILPPGCRIAGVTDSKKLSPQQREALFPRILEAAISWGIGRAEAEEIDEANIVQATYLAMRRALGQLQPAPEFVLVGGRAIPDLQIPQLGVVRGDATLLPIAAASILAKVTRDRLMAQFDDRFPGYGLARNKGYATLDHLRALRRHGPTSLHRFTFHPVAGSARLLRSSAAADNNTP